MRYVAPYGVADPDAHYINGNPSTGVQGSIPPAEAFEHPMREMSNVIVKSKITPTPTDLLQMTKAMRSQRVNYAEDTGSANQLSVSYDPPIGPYTDGLVLRVKVKSANTTAATIDAGGGRVKIVRSDLSLLQPNDLRAGGIVELVFDRTQFQMVNYIPATGNTTVTNNYNNIPYAIDGGGVNLITVTGVPIPGGGLSEGDAIFVKVKTTNTGATQIRVNALALAQVRFGDEQLLPGDLVDDEIKLLVYDGFAYQCSPNNLISQSVTIAVPSTSYGQTVNEVLALLARKRIAPGAYVTLQMAPGDDYGPIEIYHIDASRIVIRGTMNASMTHPTINDFKARGYSVAQQNTDAGENLNMLRLRYGTVIRVNASEAGIRNVGPGQPTIQNILIQGNHTTDGSIGVSVQENYSIECNGVAVWGVGGTCFSNHGYMFLYNCSGSAAYYGMSGFGCARFYIHTCISVGHAAGLVTDFFGTSELINSYFRANRIYGILCAFMSGMKIWTIDATGNAKDIQAMRMSYIWMKASTVYTTISPPADGSEGEGGSRIDKLP